MTTLKMHYEGWISLPAALRQQLGLYSGARLDVQLVDGTIVLRPAKGTRAPAEPEQAAVESPAITSAPAPSLEAVLPQKRPRGRPRNVPAIERPAELIVATGEEPLPSPKRKPGRPRKVHVEEVEPVAAPAPSSMVGEGGLWKLRPKAELTASRPEPEPVPPPRRPEPSRVGGSHEREERRPFRNVEVRKLGPGRRHHRLQRGTTPTG
jgi:AbrB family looped-hinge helix DNA binding protein